MMVQKIAVAENVKYVQEFGQNKRSPENIFGLKGLDKAVQ